MPCRVVLRRPVIRRGKPAYASSHSRSERLTSPERALGGLRIRLPGKGIQASVGKTAPTLIESSSAHNLCPCVSGLFPR